VFQVEHDAAFNSLHSDPAYKDLIAQLALPAKK
jgi:hypothetical protein